MDRPVVNVIVPSYNYGSVLRGCVRSVLEQRGVDARVLVIDDHSADDTPLVGAELAERDERVEFRRHEENKGLIATANEGLEWAATGDYVVLLSADDELAPGALERATRVMADHPEVGMVYGHAPYWHEGRDRPDPGGAWRGTDIWPGARWIRTRCRSSHNCISSPEVVVRTSAQSAVGGYDASCYHCSDLNMWLRIAAVSDVAYIRGVPQAYYRIHADSMLRSDSGPMVDLHERRQAFESFLRMSGSELEDTERLRRMVGRALAKQALWRASRAYDRGLVEGPGRLPVDELIAFAFEVFPDVARLPEWWGLQARRRIGAGRSGWFPLFLVTGASHRLRGHVRRFVGVRMGV
jgi:glycosyltransferase involved in cell wall biosynthesis